MNEARFNEIHTGLTGIAKKVYGAVPAGEPWSAKQICGEMQRATGSLPDTRIAIGCLNSLISAGLVREPKLGQFIRVQIKKKAEKGPDPELPAALFIEPEADITVPAGVGKVAASAPAAIISPINMLGELSIQLREKASSLRAIAEILEGVAGQIDSSAVEIDDEMNRERDDTKKLKQLQSLLKSIGT
jgi:hypothetical protein